MDLRQFAQHIRELSDRLENNTDALIRKVALAVDTAVVIATPVDEGRARSNWQVTVDAPAQGVIDAYEPGSEGSTGGANAQAAIDQAEEAIKEYEGGKPSSAIYISNNLPYIARLNDGWSAQAPAGFVEKGVAVGIRTAQQDSDMLLQKFAEEL